MLWARFRTILQGYRLDSRNAKIVFLFLRLQATIPGLREHSPSLRPQATIPGLREHSPSLQWPDGEARLMRFTVVWHQPFTT